MEDRAVLVEKWRPPAIFFSISVSSSHFSLSFSASALCLPFLTLHAFSWSLCLLSFSLSLPLLYSLIFRVLLPLPFTSFFSLYHLLASPTPLIHTYPSALMACVQRMQLAKPRASAEIDEYYWYSFMGCVCRVQASCAVLACLYLCQSRSIAGVCSLSPCAYEWMCMSSVDLAARGRMHFHPVCAGLHIWVWLFGMCLCMCHVHKITSGGVCINTLTCVDAVVSLHIGNPPLHMCLPYPSLTKHDP